MPFEAKRSDAKYCSGACRMAASRKRQLGAPIAPDSMPIIKTHATEEDVAAAIVTARTASNTFAQLGKAAPQPLRAGCGRIAAKIEGAIREEGW